VVSSNEFERVDNDPWQKEIIVDRQLRCTPSEWSFKARPVGDRRHYSFRVRFLAAGNVAGSLTYTAVRQAKRKTSAAPRSSSPEVTLPRLKGAKLVVEIAEWGKESLGISLFEDGKRWGKPATWHSTLADLFLSLETIKSREELIELGFGLSVDLPSALRNFLERKDASGASTMFVSNSRVAPFEILQLRPEKNGPLLGIDRPVVRWVNENPSTETVLGVHGVACVRPNYHGLDKLKYAAEEEKDLSKRFAKLKVERSKSDLDQLLEKEDQYGIIHFAGHGSDAPAQLILEGGAVKPTYFLPSKLLLRRHPLFFVNACRIGSAAPLGLAFRSNFVKILLKSCSAVVAPMIEVNSIAAREAAKQFYESVCGGATIGEAVQKIHELADDSKTPEDHKASYLSYLAFAPPALKLKFDAGVMR